MQIMPEWSHLNHRIVCNLYFQYVFADAAQLKFIAMDLYPLFLSRKYFFMHELIKGAVLHLEG